MGTAGTKWVHSVLLHCYQKRVIIGGRGKTKCYVNNLVHVGRENNNVTSSPSPR